MLITTIHIVTLKGSQDASASIMHLVFGCLEGVFALGQVYVLISRVTDPKNFMLVGVPPKDLLEPIALELLANGIDVDKYLEDACSVTRE